MASPHVDRQLDEWLDSRLSATEARHVERHLEACARCRNEAAALRAVRAAVAGRADDVALPAGLEDRIRGRLDAEDARARDQAPSHDAAPAWPAAGALRPARWALPLAAGLLLAASAVFWAVRPSSTGSGPVAAALAQFDQLTGAAETWRAAEVGSAHQLEQRWHAAELDFPARVLDLSMSGYRLAGGRATRLGERPAALAIYQGPGGVVTCWMFAGREGDEEALPPPVDVHQANGIRFHVLERGGVTLVVWREGEVLCALSARMGRDAVVALAHAKAMARPLV